MSLRRRYQAFKTISVHDRDGDVQAYDGTFVFTGTPIQDDLLVAFFSPRIGTPLSGDLTAISGSGWTIGTMQSIGSLRCYVAYRTYNTSDTLSYTMTWTGTDDFIYIQALHLRNVNLINPIGSIVMGNAVAGDVWTSGSINVPPGGIAFFLSAGDSDTSDFVSRTGTWDFAFSKGGNWINDFAYKSFPFAAFSIVYSSTWTMVGPTNGGAVTFKPIRF